MSNLTFAAAIKKAKESRFTLSSKILADNGINVQVIDNPNEMPASFNIVSKRLTLNEAHPRAKGADALIYDRGKLFHELGHALYSKDPTAMRKTLCDKSHNQDGFLNVSNILEDGRIERLLCEEWHGAKDYLDALLAAEIGSLTDNPENGLALYVRTGFYRNAKEEKMFAPYKAQIDHAVNGAKNTGEVCEIAFDIVEKLYPKSKPPEEKPEGEGQGQGQGQGQSSSSDKAEEKAEDDEAESSEDAQGEGEDDSEGKDEESEENEGSGQSESTGDPSEDESEDEAEESGSEGHGIAHDDTVSGLSDAAKEAIEKIVEEARENVEDEAEADYESILDEAREMMQNQPQEYASNDEESIAEDLASVFTSLQVEANRTQFTPSREGILNSLQLSSALTTRKCFHVREETLGEPFVALLVDTSGSQGCRANALSRSARVIHGALQKAKVNVCLIQYDQGAIQVPNAPLEGWACIGMSTNTGLAMNIANNWIEEKQATRALMLIVTDGEPDKADTCQAERIRCEGLNGYVLGVRVGFAKGLPETRQEKVQLPMQFNAYVNVPDAQDLPEAIEPFLESFLMGA